MFKWNVSVARNRNQGSAIRSQDPNEIQPPHSVISGSLDGKASVQPPINQGVTTAPSIAQVLEQWSTGQRPDFMPPSYSGQRDNGWNKLVQMPILQGVPNAYPLAKLLDNGPAVDLPGIRKKAVSVKARAIRLFKEEAFRGQHPLRQSALLVAGWGGGGARMPIRFGGNLTPGCHSFWRQSDLKK